MLVGRHLYGATIIRSVEDIAAFYRDGNNDLRAGPTDACGLADLLLCLYSYRLHLRRHTPKNFAKETKVYIDESGHLAYVIEADFNCFRPYQSWWTIPSVYVAIVGVGSWMTPGARLIAYDNNYIAEKLGLSGWDKQGQRKQISVLQNI